VAELRVGRVRMPWVRGGSSRRRMPFAAFVVAGAVTVGGALGGCTGGSEPDPSPSVSSGSSSSSASVSVTPSPSPSVTASGPEIPAAAREQTEAGAEAFVRFFFDQLNTAWTEPRAGLIESLSDPACKFCSLSENDAAYLVAEKQRYERVPAEVLEVEAFVGAPAGQQYLAAKIDQKNVRILDQAGEVVGTDQHKVIDRNVALVWSVDRWLMLEVEKSE